jgi:hypothetical protein
MEWDLVSGIFFARCCQEWSILAVGRDGDCCLFVCLLWEREREKKPCDDAGLESREMLAGFWNSPQAVELDAKERI